MRNTEIIYASVEFIAIFSALFYLLNVPFNIRKLLILLLGVVLPTTLAFIQVHWLGIITLILSTVIVFYIFSRNIRILIDIFIVFIGGILTDHLAQTINGILFSGRDMGPLVNQIWFLPLFFLFIYGYKRLIETKWHHFKGSSITITSVVLIVCTTVSIFYWNIFTISTVNAQSLVRINLVIQLGYIVLIGILFGLLYFRMQRKQQIQQREIELEQFMMYTKALEQVNRDMQKFRHDYANILQTIQGYLDMNNLEELKQYFKQHIVTSGEHALFKNRVISSLNHLQLVGLRGLLAAKSLQADEQGIRISIHIPEPINAIQMDIIDLTRVLGILTDNAIEANHQIEQGQIKISIERTESPSVIIRIQNTFQEKTMQLADLDKESFSTKGKNRGIGLANVRQILHQYENALLKTQIDEDWFIQELEIYFIQ